ncbi:hypothetical protein PTSG_07063 [Salpingoeca rosetta]|uniref:Uncharacterized protein n=1 Tax=Salpingoeca rosetta (strain ATCC 50818 / BSB-021) TaxID=946362 RepID=F2UDY2_SALR5|nr:uncharacterized protein PTSG_07063 [Salpingoeca rosetta]EGD74832.1 hypothetical protein PTSG_07063 [Salpingoeca rosetta]|eukprot:XP_004992477.1 hypothetical protein PTSG_07063 [Salpingoeca rosetta]
MVANTASRKNGHTPEHATTAQQLAITSHHDASVSSVLKMGGDDQRKQALPAADRLAKHSPEHGTITPLHPQHSTAQHSTAQHSTAQQTMFAFPGSGGFYSDPFGVSPRRTRRAPPAPPAAAAYQDPYAMPQRRAPRRSPRSPQRREVEVEPEEFADEDLYRSMDPFARMMYGMDPYEAQRRRKAAQEQERARQARLREQKLAKMRKAALMRGYNRAATTIQRAYRAHRKAKHMAEREGAALVITRFMRAVPSVRRAKKIAASLRQLRSLEQELVKMTAAYQQRPWGYRNTLWFVDQVEKLILRLDEVQPHRSEFVRHRRKDVVQHAQQSLRYADCVMRMFKRKAQVLARALRTHLHRKHAHHRNAAARVVQRVMQGVPKVKQARQVRTALQQVRTELSQLHDLRQRYIDALQSASSMLHEHEHEHGELALESDALDSALSQLTSLVAADLPALTGSDATDDYDYDYDDTASTTRKSKKAKKASSSKKKKQQQHSKAHKHHAHDDESAMDELEDQQEDDGDGDELSSKTRTALRLLHHDDDDEGATELSEHTATTTDAEEDDDERHEASRAAAAEEPTPKKKKRRQKKRRNRKLKRSVVAV